MAPKIINLMAGLKQRTLKSGQTRAFVEIKAEDLTFVNDPEGLAKGVAEAIRAAISTNLKAGLAPDGSPLPTVAPATVERREYRDMQYATGSTPVNYSTDILLSIPSPGLSWGDKRKQERLNRRLRVEERRKRRESRASARGLKGRFTAPKLGEYDPRTHDNLRFGRESGMLADSLIVIAARGAWLLRFAMPRGKPDNSGASAVDRVFSRIGLWTQGAQNNPAVQAALRSLANGLVVNKPAESLFLKARGVLSLIRTTFGEVRQISGTLEDVSEGE